MLGADLKYGVDGHGLADLQLDSAAHERLKAGPLKAQGVMAQCQIRDVVIPNAV
jgi:hypothetical protein